MSRRLTSRRSFLLAAAAVAGCSRADSRLQRAAQFLWARQEADGGWHSQTYGLLRSGQSLTPFVLDALLDVPGTVLPEPAGAIERAIGFIKKNLNRDGMLGSSDSTAADYPNYATGLAVRAMVRAKAPGWEPMLAALRAQQLTEQNGWHREDPAYGAWGMGGERRTPPDAGHVDLSMTRIVLEGFAAAEVSPSDEALNKATVYIERCQNPDGGFFFSTVENGINKAGETSAGKYLSYGSTTADGILAMRAAGITENDPRMSRAKKWLRDHHLYDRVPGFEGTARETWAHALRFYYAAAISSAMPELTVLLPEPRTDGSYANTNNLVKEDDPLIATAFAVRTLCQHGG